MSVEENEVNEVLDGDLRMRISQSELDIFQKEHSQTLKEIRYRLLPFQI